MSRLIVRLHQLGLCAVLLGLGVAEAAPTLQELIDKTLIRHPAVTAQRSLLQASNSGVQGAKLQFLPALSYSQERLNSRDGVTPGLEGDRMVTVWRIQQPLWTGGRLSAGLERAEAERLLADAGLDATRQALSVRVVQTYAEWLEAQGRLDALAASRAMHEQLLAQVSRRTDLGASPQSDITLVQSRLQAMTADVATAELAVRSALNRLTQLTGEPVASADLAGAATAPCALAEPLDGLINQAMAASPGLARARALARQVAAEADLKKASIWPEVALRWEQQSGDFASRGLPRQTRAYITLNMQAGGGFSPLLDVAAANRRQDAARADFEAEILALTEQLRGDYLTSQWSRSKLSALEAAREANKDIFDAWGRQFLAGKKTWLDVMNAAREAAITAAQVAEARAAWVLSSWRLHLYAGDVAGLPARCLPDPDWKLKPALLSSEPQRAQP